MERANHIAGTVLSVSALLLTVGTPTATGIHRELKKIRNSVGAHPALTFVENESQIIGGFGSNDRFSYVQRFGGPGEVANRVLLEAGSTSGREPTTVVELQSYLGQFLAETGVFLDAEDEAPFPNSAGAQIEEQTSHRRI